eukprot:1233257-Pleurochrysis_carterae.AAC.2
MRESKKARVRAREKSHTLSTDAFARDVQVYALHPGWTDVEARIGSQTPTQTPTQTHTCTHPQDVSQIQNAKRRQDTPLANADRLLASTCCSCLIPPAVACEHLLG